MNWISPTFGKGDAFEPPPKKKIKSTETTKAETPITSRIQSTSSNWLQQYKPKSVDELAVHVKKVKEVETWLEQYADLNPVRKFLLLTGPSGCGKTTTLHTVCKRLDLKILEWITPLDKPADDLEFTSKFEFSKSAAKLFEEYLFRSSRYSSCLNVIPTKKLVLVKDFPNVFLHNPSTFHDILERFSDKCVNAVVFICSDESHCRKLFTPTLKTNCGIQTIAFNPIPDQRIFKVLKAILLQESKVNKSIKMIPDDGLYAISTASYGDLRSAISKMCFCSINSIFDISHLKSQGKFKKPKSCNDNTTTDKDQRIDFFHGIGRVLYPKKIHSDKGLKFVHSTEAVVENFLSEPKTFINQLHENYPSKMGNVYDLSNAAEKMSKSDVLMSRWQDKEIFRNYSLSVAVQGLMVCNKNPQKSKFEAFKRSQTSQMEVDSKAIELEGKALFSDLSILDYGCLVDILPYSRFLLPNLNEGQLEYVRKTCYFR